MQKNALRVDNQQEKNEHKRDTPQTYVASSFFKHKLIFRINAVTVLWAPIGRSLAFQWCPVPQDRKQKLI